MEAFRHNQKQRTDGELIVRLLGAFKGSKPLAIGLLVVVLEFGIASQAGAGDPNAGYAPPPPAGTNIPPGITITQPQPIKVIHTTTPDGAPLVESIEPDTVEPINTVLNFSTPTGPGTCYWSTEFGNFDGVAYGKLMWDSGNCNTTSYPNGGPPPYDDSLGNDQITADLNGSLVPGNVAEVKSFSTWYQSLYSGASVVGETFYVCGEAVPGTIQDGVYCFEYNFTV
jgi:hypothetical protein